MPGCPWGRQGGREANARHGSWDHRSLLDNTRTVGVSRAPASLEPAEATWSSLTGVAASDSAVVFVTTVKYGATARVAHPITPFLATVLVPSPWSTLVSRYCSAARCLTLAMNACQSDPSAAHVAKAR